MIVNRDSNDIGFMDIKTNKMIGNVFLGQQRQPAHGDDVAGRPLRRHRRHARQQGVHHRHADAAARQGHPDRHRARAPRVLARQPLVLPGQSGRRLDLGDRHAVAEQDQDDPGVRRAAQRHLPARRVEGLHRQLRRALGRRDRRAAARAAQEDPGRAACRASRSWIPAKYLGEIKGINIAAPSIDGRYLYAADSDLAIVGVIDTREDKVIKTIRVGPRSVAHLHEPRRQVRHHRQQRRRDDLDHRHAHRTAWPRRSKRART